MRVKVDFRTASKENYKDFRKTHKDIKLSYNEWSNIIYLYNDYFREYLLETGESGKLPSGFGEFRIIKKKRTKTIERDGKTLVNLAVNWPRSKEKGKKIYNMNFDTDGYFFGLRWNKRTAHLPYTSIWTFKTSRATKKVMTHYIRLGEEYTNKYHEGLFTK